MEVDKAERWRSLWKDIDEMIDRLVEMFDVIVLDERVYDCLHEASLKLAEAKVEIENIVQQSQLEGK